MKNNAVLILVENQSKRKTYTEQLNRDEYVVLSTGGKIITSKNHPNYQMSQKFLENIKEQALNYSRVYLAMDDDYEGENLSYNLIHYLELKNAFRITPSEINTVAIESAISEARELNENIVRVQQTKNTIKKIVDNSISKAIKWFFKKEGLVKESDILKNLGISRVSAASLALIVDAEEKIDTFIPEFYKKVYVDYFYDNIPFRVKNRTKFTKEKREELLTFMSIVNKEVHVISKFDRGTKDRTPPPPLNAVWLQRAANSQFGFSSKKTMELAKKLYEGIMIDGKKVGLITYYKTNSFFISEEAIYNIIQLLLEKFGEKYTFTTRRVFKKTNNTTTKEAIRPVNFEDKFYPQNIKKYFKDEDEDLYFLYEYIYHRTIATQMTSAVYDRSELVVTIGGAQFKAIANEQLFDGWQLLGENWVDDEEDNKEKVVLPENLKINQILKPLEVGNYEVKERTPWRYGEGRFLTTLEKYNIADASFIGNITSFLEDKKYINIVKGMIYPTELGKKIHYFLEEYAPWLTNIEIVEKFQNDMHLIEIGEKTPDSVIQEYQSYKADTFLKLGYLGDENSKPEEWLVKKAKTIASKNKQNLSKEILSNKKMLLKYVTSNNKDIESIGKCPSCGGDIYINEHGYRCSGCSFMLWNSSIEKFLDLYSKHIPQTAIPKYISIILKKGKCYIDNLYSSKKDKFFGSYVQISFKEKYNGWFLSLASMDSKSNEDEAVNFMPTLDKEEAKEEKEHKISKENYMLRQQLIQEQKERRLISDESKKDPMTRAYNRLCFDSDMQKFFEIDKTNLSLAFIDGDKFKNINDTYGHQAGDEVLKFLVNKMFTNISKIKRARVYRYGGEEFLILFIDEKRADVIKCLNALRMDIESSKIVHDSKDIKITISVGVSFGKSSDEIKDLVQRADNAVYLAKENGRNRIEVED